MAFVLCRQQLWAACPLDGFDGGGTLRLGDGLQAAWPVGGRPAPSEDQLDSPASSESHAIGRDTCAQWAGAGRAASIPQGDRMEASGIASPPRTAAKTLREAAVLMGGQEVLMLLATNPALNLGGRTTRLLAGLVLGRMAPWWCNRMFLCVAATVPSWSPPPQESTQTGA